MPIYEYQCRSCGHEFETIQKVTDAPMRQCPSCGQPELTKLVSAAGFRLKGGGWYETDFKAGTEKKRNLAGSGEAAGGDGQGGSEKSTTATEKPAAASGEKTTGAAS
ncbi:MAG: zinc ribbon domain-containing protein [Methylotetracoccus sp.]|nr:zinc ribbon domain-containing protein [Methylotetracoccus sp.]